MHLVSFDHMPPLTRGMTKTLLIMKLTAILMLGFSLQVSANVFSQKVTLNEKNVSLQKVFKQIHRQTGYQFFYEDELLDKSGKVDIQVTNMPLEDALKACFKNLPLSYKVINKTIVVNAKPPVVVEQPVEDPLPPPPPEVRGIVLNDKGEPVEGASVIVKGTQKGAVTNASGVFILSNINENDILIISGANIETLEVALNGKTAIIVNVKNKISFLDDIQVIGYGQTTRRLSTSSIGTVKKDVLEKQPVANPIQALQGRVAGVAITQTSGAIGSGVEIQIRGINTIESGNQPLVIVDGAVLPEPNRGLGTAIGSYMPWGSSSMNNLNPADIESIEILKDADATAIYGSRGANGVILITTKKATLGTTRFTMDVGTWVNSATILPERLNLQQYRQMRKDAFAMGNYNPNTLTAINPITPNANTAPDLLVWDSTKATTDWPNFEYGNGSPAVNVQASLTGGDKRLNFIASAGYLKQNDITRGSPFQERISTSLGLNHTSSNNRLRFGANASYLVNNIFPSRGAGSPGLMSSLPPNMPMQNADGTPFWPPPNITQNSLLMNPLAAEEAQTTSVSDNLIGNLNFGYRIAKGLDFKTTIGYNEQGLNNKTLTPSTSINPLNPGTSVPSSSFNKSTFKSLNIEPQLDYTTQISKGKLDVLLGSTLFDQKRTQEAIAFNGFTSDALLNSWAAGSNVSNRSNSSGNYRFNSVFGRVNYNWENKYIANISYRRDGSSRFGPKNQFGNFGAIGAAWIFTSEDWFKNLLPSLSFGKLRGSYGTAGNDAIADYRWTSLYTTAMWDGRSGLAPSYLSDSTVGWESSKKLDVALELGFLKNRILLNVNWYRTLSTDLLLSTPVPAQTGFTTFISNVPAEVENKGWEFELNTKNLNPTNKLQWNTTFNISLLKNRLVEFPGLENSSFANRLKIGLPINSPRTLLNSEWSQVYEGVNPETGLPIFKDLDNNGTINNNDRTYIGSAIPRTYGGLGNQLSYKGFEFDLFFQFSQQLATNYLFNSIYPGQLNNPVSEFYGNYWRQPGDVTKYPRLWSGVASNTTTAQLSNIFPTSSAALQDMFYVRLKNISLSYSLPTEWVSKAKMTRATIYVRGQNVFTWMSEDLKKDPELVTLRGGMMLKTWTAGIQLTL
jgi:TonB-linked SusC/RagA family outer membrane protein